MADTKVSLLSAASYLDGVEEFPLSDGTATSKKATASQIRAGVFCKLTADYTLTSTTGVQKLFNASTNGAVTLPTGTYLFECMVHITGMSSTSGNGAFSLAGTATRGSQLMSSVGIDATTTATAAAQGGAFVQGGSAFTTNTVTAATGTAVGFRVRGTFNVTASGTVIPSIALVTATAAVVKAGSYFRAVRIAPDATNTLGNWS